MGEMADYYLDSEELQDYDNEMSYIAPQNKECYYCGRNDLHWVTTPLGWRLATPSDKLHTCKQYREKKMKEIKGGEP